MSRKFETPEKYKNKFRYSFSKISSHRTCPFQTYLALYTDAENKNNIYSLLGTESHSIIQDHIEDKIEKEDMIHLFRTKYYSILDAGYKFNSDEEKHNNMAEKYFENIKHFFKNFKKDKWIHDIEVAIWTDIEGRPFLGFVDDKVTMENNKIRVVDFKTSTIYTGKKIDENKQQLVLYGKAIHEEGVPIEDIQIGWNFLKYATVTFNKINKHKVKYDSEIVEELILKGLIKSKRTKSIEVPVVEKESFTCERIDIGIKISKHLQKIMKEEMYDESDIKGIINKLISTNDISVIPSNLLNKYEIEINDAFVEIPFNENVIKEVENDIIPIILDIENRHEQMKDKEKEEVEIIWDRPPITDGDSFFCSMLCSYNHACKYYKEYKDNKELFLKEEYKEDIDILRGNSSAEITENDLNELDSLLDGIFDEINIEEEEINIEDIII